MGNMIFDFSLFVNTQIDIFHKKRYTLCCEQMFIQLFKFLRGLFVSSRTDLLVRISELYYQQNLSQQDISKITGISRPTISRLLDEAKETGVVEIIVHSPINKNPQLSHLVRTTFGLRDAVIVAGDYDFDQSLTRCAHCAVDFLSTVLENNMSIGISWGRALEALCDVLEPTNYSDYYNVTVVQMVGCLGTGNPRVDGLELALRLSKKVNGTYSNIYAPVYVDSELVYSYLTAEPQIEATLKKAGTVDIILTGIGSLNDANGSLYKSGCYNAEERKELMRRGAVSSLLGRMFDINGSEVQLDGRYVISAPLEAMRKPSWSIGINASAEKAECTLAAVHGKYINVLVADEPLARRMLEMEGVAVPE